MDYSRIHNSGPTARKRILYRAVLVGSVQTDIFSPGREAESEVTRPLNESARTGLSIVQAH